LEQKANMVPSNLIKLEDSPFNKKKGAAKSSKI
jgi:hypothetical protein